MPRKNHTRAEAPSRRYPFGATPDHAVRDDDIWHAVSRDMNIHPSEEYCSNADNAERMSQYNDQIEARDRQIAASKRLREAEDSQAEAVVAAMREPAEVDPLALVVKHHDPNSTDWVSRRMKVPRGKFRRVHGQLKHGTINPLLRPDAAASAMATIHASSYTPEPAPDGSNLYLYPLWEGITEPSTCQLWYGQFGMHHGLDAINDASTPRPQDTEIIYDHRDLPFPAMVPGQALGRSRVVCVRSMLAEFTLRRLADHLALSHPALATHAPHDSAPDNLIEMLSSDEITDRQRSLARVLFVTLYSMMDDIHHTVYAHPACSNPRCINPYHQKLCRPGDTIPYQLPVTTLPLQCRRFALSAINKRDRLAPPMTITPPDKFRDDPSGPMSVAAAMGPLDDRACVDDLYVDDLAWGSMNDLWVDILPRMPRVAEHPARFVPRAFQGTTQFVTRERLMESRLGVDMASWVPLLARERQLWGFVDASYTGEDITPTDAPSPEHSAADDDKGGGGATTSSEDTEWLNEKVLEALNALTPGDQ